MINETHDVAAQSWVESANLPRVDFPIQNLPFCSFSIDAGTPRLGVGIGDQILDLTVCVELGLFDELAPQVRVALTHDKLNAFMALGRDSWRATRKLLFALLDANGPGKQRASNHRDRILVAQSAATLVLPMRIGDFTDFECSHPHAVRMRRLMRGEPRALTNGYHLPRGYHSRSSSVIVSGEPVYLPSGQIQEGDAPPEYKPCERLDYELELGIVIGQGNERGHPIPVGEAQQHIFGFCILNDWSARDIQRWESPTLGPFNAKNHQTSISPWIVTMEAMAPFRTAQTQVIEGRPERPLPYLDSETDRASGALDIGMNVYLSTERMRADQVPAMKTSSNTFLDAGWTIAQMIAHHTGGGCNLQPGDLIGSGTISGIEDHASACLMELTEFGAKPVQLPGGETRGFLRIGDEVTIEAACVKDGFARIGFGKCQGLVQAMPTRRQA